METEPQTSLAELARVFLKLGTIAFGGPAAHIAMMEDEFVVRRQWLARDEFLDLIGAANLIPGPNSTEVAIHVGRARRGIPGLLVAGACFIIPAALIVAAVAWAYVRFGQLPAVARVFYALKPVVIAIVAQAIVRLGRSATKSWTLAAIGAAAVLATVTGVNEIVVLLASGLLAIAVTRRARPTLAATAFVPMLQASAGGIAQVSLATLFGTFVKIGAVLFGSGYVLLAFLRADFIEHLHWLTERQLLDAVAVGQMTPGPVFTTATFVGYLVAGGSGAAVATIGIFLPAFAFVALSAPIVARIRRSANASAFLDGVNVGALALMAVVTYQLGRVALVDLLTWGMALVALLLLVRYRVNSAWLIGAAIVIGVARALV
ncbi:MAG TPA: chromate efflux transporter [Gemmatimonadaceae bacterium]|nr:chromate efflux transporter [Gemmatimonadaceae bacterium]